MENFISRKEAVALLNSLGYKISYSALASMSCYVRGGPPSFRARGMVFYDRDVLTAWAKARPSADWLPGRPVGRPKSNKTPEGTIDGDLTELPPGTAILNLRQCGQALELAGMPLTDTGLNVFFYTESGGPKRYRENGKLIGKLWQWSDVLAWQTERLRLKAAQAISNAPTKFGLRFNGQNWRERKAAVELHKLKPKNRAA